MLTSARLLLGFLLFLAPPVQGKEYGAPHAPFTVQLDEERQRLAGIRTLVLPQPQPLPARPALAQVLDPTALIEAAYRYRGLFQDLQRARESARIAQQRHRRLQRLGASIQRREREQARLDFIEAQGKVRQLSIRLEALQQRLQVRWGPVLSDWITRKSHFLEALSRGDVSLLRLVPAEDGSAWVDHHGRPIPLEPISPDPRSDPLLSEPAAFFLARQFLPHGIRLEARFESGRTAIPVPAAALVWYGGTPWVYVKVAEESFQRRRIEGQGDRERWWASSGVKGGETVVVTGAQLLLAEEFRAQVPEEDDD